MSVFWAVVLFCVASWIFYSPRHRAGRGAWGREREAALQQLEETMGRLVEDVGALRAEVAELAERVDFTERALTTLRRNAVGAGHESSGDA